MFTKVQEVLNTGHNYGFAVSIFEICVTTGCKNIEIVEIQSNKLKM